MTSGEDRVRFRNEIMARGFTPAYAWVICDKRISAGALRVYLFLAWMAGQDGMCFPGQGYIAKAIDRNDRTVRKLINELEDAGLLTIVRRGLRKTNEYWLEDVNRVYGDDENAMIPSSKALSSCWPVGAKGRERIDAVAPTLPDKRILVAKEAIETARERTKAGRDKQAERALAREGRKVTKKKVKVAKGMGLKEIERQWRDAWASSFPGRTVGRWNARDFAVVRELVEIYGADLTLKVSLHVVENWQELVYRFKLKGYPSIRVVNGYRDTLFPEIESGEVLDAAGRRSETREDEWNEAKGKTDSAGW